jgi:hypothetical protein
MFGRERDRTTTSTVAVQPIEARGGVTGGSVFTGVVVAFGAMFLLSALIGGILVSLGLLDDNITNGDAVNAGIGAGLALVIAQFLAYLWGGYTAGRMGRGSGLANGVLVPIVAIVIGLAIGGVVTSLGVTVNLNLPLSVNRLPIEGNYLVNWGIGIGIASLVAMFLGGILGGLRGVAWHTRLEHETYEEYVEDRSAGAVTDGTATTRNRTVTLDGKERDRVSS